MPHSSTSIILAVVIVALSWFSLSLAANRRHVKKLQEAGVVSSGGLPSSVQSSLASRSRFANQIKANARLPPCRRPSDCTERM
ncbi:hypothetical protein F4801DRAFT_533229 [Xylaria longipes]|nr:hypothetical protein F4801DRAFT_533229 [Xylaria longipes]